MKREENKVALIVHTCDRYELLYQGFAFFFHKHWDFNIPTNNYFATEEKCVNVNGFTNILSGKGEWSDRLFNLLKNEIKEDYVLYFQEDMWLTKPVDYQFFNEIILYAMDNSVDCIKLHSTPDYHTISTNLSFAGLSFTKLDNEKSDFLMSHQVTLWKKDFLMAQLQEHEHPWRNERKATKRLKKLNSDIYQIDFFGENGKAEINQNKSSVNRSEYFSVSVNGVFDECCIDFLNEMSKDKSHLEYSRKLRYHYENHLTHDGKRKPRKEDFMQRLKRWLREINN